MPPSKSHYCRGGQESVKVSPNKAKGPKPEADCGSDVYIISNELNLIGLENSHSYDNSHPGPRFEQNLESFADSDPDRCRVVGFLRGS